jgi:RNA polymerase sigma-70 factor (ECF subfamily)
LSLTKQNIESLLALCQEENRLAQLEVYNRYQKAMYNIAVRIVKNTAEAEDVMQESFITAFSKLDTFKGTATFGAWLKRIVVNNSIAHYRKSQRFVNVDEEQLHDGIEETVERANDDYSQVRSQQLNQAMELLNDGYKNILSLHYIEGYDYEEICEILKISYANCRTMVSRAKESLRKKIATL